jgi:hypothetical protein
VLAALVLCGLLLAAAQGSFTVARSAGAAWTGPCIGRDGRQDRRQLAFCARVEGRVVADSHGPSAGEVHVAVLGDFHLVLVKLPAGRRTPSWGSDIVAVGPLVRGRDGLLEVGATQVTT